MYTRTFFQRCTALALLGVVAARALSPTVASTSTITHTRAARRVAMPVHPTCRGTRTHSLKILQRTVRGRGGAPPPSFSLTTRLPAHTVSEAAEGVIKVKPVKTVQVRESTAVHGGALDTFTPTHTSRVCPVFMAHLRRRRKP